MQIMIHMSKMMRYYNYTAIRNTILLTVDAYNHAQSLKMKARACKTIVTYHDCLIQDKRNQQRFISILSLCTSKTWQKIIMA